MTAGAVRWCGMAALVVMLGWLALTVPWSPRAEADEVLRHSENLVSRLGDSAVTVLRDERLDGAARREALEDLVDRYFDLQRIARLALGRHWQAASPAERERYSELFERYMLVTYGRLVDAYSDERLVVTGAKPVTGGVMVVSRLGGQQPVLVEWRVTGEADQLRIVDVVVEGVSMLLTQRNDFSAVIERSGGRIAALIEHLERRIADLATSAT